MQGIRNVKGEEMARFGSVLMLMALLVSSIFLSACSSGTVTAKEGDTVKVLYTGTLDDGTVFDSSELEGGDPLEFTIGEGKLLAGFEQAVIGLSINESTTVHIPADEAYGPLEVVADIDEFPEDEMPVVGDTGYWQLDNGMYIQVEVIEVSESSVTMENRQQLAGEDLNFEITLVEILKPTPTPTLTPTTSTTQTAKEGDTVRVDYTGTLDNGTVFDSSIDPSFGHVEPLEFTIGEGTLLAGFEQAVIGLSINESTTVYIPADEAYGPYNEELVVTLDWSQMGGYVPEVGERLTLYDNSTGENVYVTVLDVSETGVTVDANNQLAGEDLNFEITLVEIL
jgi:peptidylprolyl isomerase